MGKRATGIALVLGDLELRSSDTARVNSADAARRLRVAHDDRHPGVKAAVPTQAIYAVGPLFAAHLRFSLGAGHGYNYFPPTICEASHNGFSLRLRFVGIALGVLRFRYSRCLHFGEQ